LPSLKDRIEDLEVNIEYELEKNTEKYGTLVSFNKLAKNEYLHFAKSAEAIWRCNFRDLNASITRMSTLADGGRINSQGVKERLCDLGKTGIRQRIQPLKLMLINISTNPLIYLNVSSSQALLKFASNLQLLRKRVEHYLISAV